LDDVIYGYGYRRETPLIVLIRLRDFARQWIKIAGCVLERVLHVLAGESARTRLVYRRKRQTCHKSSEALGQLDGKQSWKGFPPRSGGLSNIDYNIFINFSFLC